MLKILKKMLELLVLNSDIFTSKIEKNIKTISSGILICKNFFKKNAGIASFSILKKCQNYYSSVLYVKMH
jgi:hypothetical protein